MYFLNPAGAWLLASLPVAVLIVALGLARQRKLLHAYGEPRLIAAQSRLLSRRVRLAQATALLLAWLLISLAVMRPSSDNGTVEFPSGSVDAVVALDVSRSMAALDYRGQVPDQFGHGTRIDMARYLIAAKMTPALASNHMGMVTYAGHPFLQAFLSDDMQALTYVLTHSVKIGSAPGEGSAMYSAIMQAVQVLQIDSAAGHQRVLVIFSDGGNDEVNNERLLTAARHALRQMNVQVVVCGLGSSHDSLIPVAELPERDRNQLQGKAYYEYRGDVIKTKIDQQSLARLARQLGGTYVRIESPSDFHLDGLVNNVHMLHRKGQNELFPLALFLAAVCLLVSALCGTQFHLPQWRWKIASRSSTSARRGSSALGISARQVGKKE